MAYAILSNSVNQSINTNANTTLSFDTAVESGGNFWNPATPTKLIVPTGITELEFFFTSFGSAASTATDTRIIFTNGITELALVLQDNDFYTSFAFCNPHEIVIGDQKYQIDAARFGTGLVTFNAGFTVFSACTTERQGLVGAVPNGNQVITTTPLALTWTPDIDTANTFNGTSGFVVPVGTTACIVSMEIHPSVDDADDIVHEVQINGVTVRKYANNYDSRANGPGCFGVIACVAGDVITIKSSVIAGAGMTFVSTYSHLGIEWLP